MTLRWPRNMSIRVLSIQWCTVWSTCVRYNSGGPWLLLSWTYDIVCMCLHLRSNINWKCFVNIFSLPVWRRTIISPGARHRPPICHPACTGMHNNSICTSNNAYVKIISYRLISDMHTHLKYILIVSLTPCILVRSQEMFGNCSCQILWSVRLYVFTILVKGRIGSLYAARMCVHGVIYTQYELFTMPLRFSTSKV